MSGKKAVLMIENISWLDEREKADFASEKNKLALVVFYSRENGISGPLSFLCFTNIVKF